MIELSFQFNRLFKLSVNHDFYENKKWSNSKVVPDISTSQHIKKLNLLYREEEGGFVILHDASKRQALINQLKAEDYDLNFFLFPEDYSYINYTDLPVNEVNKVAYFSSSSIKGLKPEEVFKMHESDKVDESCFFETFSSDIELQGTDGKAFRLLGDKNEILVDKKIESDSKNYIGITKFNSGKYFLEIDEKLSKTLIFFKGGVRSKPVAFVNISLSGSVKEKIIQSLEHGEELPHFSFEINFSSRATFWKYYVVPKYAKELETTVVKDTGKKLEFSSPVACELQNGLKAFCFESDQPIPLSELPKVKFQLKKKNGKDSGGRSLIDHLPVASTDRIVPVQDGKNEKIYSEIIIHL